MWFGLLVWACLRGGCQGLCVFVWDCFDLFVCLVFAVGLNLGCCCYV